MTRAEMMKIVLEARFDETFSSIDNSLVKEQRSTMTDCYDDVNDEWYARYICYASDYDMVQGIGDGDFGPENTVTIAQ